MTTASCSSTDDATDPRSACRPGRGPRTQLVGLLHERLVHRTCSDPLETFRGIEAVARQQRKRTGATLTWVGHGGHGRVRAPRNQAFRGSDVRGHRRGLRLVGVAVHAAARHASRRSSRTTMVHALSGDFHSDCMLGAGRARSREAYARANAEHSRSIGARSRRCVQIGPVARVVAAGPLRRTARGARGIARRERLADSTAALASRRSSRSAIGRARARLERPTDAYTRLFDALDRDRHVVDLGRIRRSISTGWVLRNSLDASRPCPSRVSANEETGRGSW